MSIFTFIDGFPPSQLIVFCRSPPGICAVSTKKRDDSFHYEEQVSPVQGTRFPYWPQWSFFPLTSVNELLRASHRALRFHFGNPNITERSIPVVLTAYVGGFLSIHFALHPTPMWESDLHTSISSPPKQVSKASGKLEGIELALKVSYVWCCLFTCISFGSLFVKQCRVEETLTKPCFVLIGLVMFFNIANLDTK